MLNATHSIKTADLQLAEMLSMQQCTSASWLLQRSTVCCCFCCFRAEARLWFFVRQGALGSRSSFASCTMGSYSVFKAITYIGAFDKAQELL
jgi:hypothetical protein